jgi:hypothetical protein
MKNSTLIVAGLGVAAVAAFLIYKKRSEQSATSDEMKSVDETAPQAETKAPISDTVKPISLTTKKVSSSRDLIGTPLGTFISVQLASDDAKKKIDDVIKSLSSSEKIILEHIVLPTDDVRDSEEYDNALVSKYGNKATKIKSTVIERLGAASRFKTVSTTAQGQGAVGKLADAISKIFGNKAEQAVDRIQENVQERKQCRKAAREHCGRGLGQGKPKCRREFRKRCIAEGGYDEGGEDFAFSFTSDKLSSENEIFAFNGHTF